MADLDESPFEDSVYAKRDTIYGIPCLIPLPKKRGKVERNKKICRLYKEGMTQRDIAKKYNISSTRVWQIIMLSLKKRKPKFADRDARIYLAYKHKHRTRSELAEDYDVSRATILRIIKSVKIVEEKNAT